MESTDIGPAFQTYVAILDSTLNNTLNSIG